MRFISKAGGLGVLVMTCAAMAVTGWGSTASPTASGSATPSGSTTAPTVSPSPSASPSAPGYTIYTSRTSYTWHWPNDASRPATVQHVYPVPPMPRLIAINVGDHTAFGSERHYNRMSFTFTTAFPSYQVAYADVLTSDPAGKPIALAGGGVLKIIFRQAQATPIKAARRSSPSRQLA